MSDCESVSINLEPARASQSALIKETILVIFSIFYEKSLLRFYIAFMGIIAINEKNKQKFTTSP